jgi:NADH dehydrogenase
LKVVVTGGTGFVGSAVIRELRARGIATRALVRSAQQGERLERLGVEAAYGDVTDADSVLAAARGCTHAIHLVAIIRGRASQFDRVMVEGTRNVIAGCRAAAVERLVQTSALGLDERTRTLTPYFAAKWQMEADVKASTLEYAIIRPSFVFGKGGGVMPTFVRQVRFSPVVSIIGSGRSRLQPVWLDDVAAHLVTALDLAAAANGTFELGGPDVVTWNELYRRLAETMGKQRLYVHVPVGVVRTVAALTERVPGAPISTDQVTMLEAGDNIVRENDAAAVFGLPRVSLADQLQRAI